VARAWVDPKRPGGQSLHAPAPARLYLPTPHATAVGDVDPAAQAYPAVQVPLQSAVGREGAAPHLPAAHREQVAAPAREYLPATHRRAVGLVDPGAHANPGLQLPSQVAVAWPGTEPYRPPSHSPVQEALDIAGVAPYKPAAHMAQAPEPARLYFPDGHVTAVPLVEAGGQAYPGLQTPAQDVEPMAAANWPAGHSLQVGAPARL
jgi:hypothetical protein